MQVLYGHVLRSATLKEPGVLPDIYALAKHRPMRRHMRAGAQQAQAARRDAVPVLRARHLQPRRWILCLPQCAVCSCPAAQRVLLILNTFASHLHSCAWPEGLTGLYSLGSDAEKPFFSQPDWAHACNAQASQI